MTNVQHMSLALSQYRSVFLIVLKELPHIWFCGNIKVALSKTQEYSDAHEFHRFASHRRCLRRLSSNNILNRFANFLKTVEWLI